MSDDRPSAYYEGDVLILRASAFGGGCMWELAAAAQEYPPLPFPDALLKAFDDGNRLEPKIIDYMANHGWTFLSHQSEGELEITPTLKIRYHSDGIASRDATRDLYVVEAKALGPDLFNQAVRHGVQTTIPHYPWQLSAMMHAEGKPGVWCAHNKETGAWYTQTVQVPPITLKDIRDRALAIQALIEEDDIVDSGRPCDDPDHWPCLYRHLRPEPGLDGDNVAGQEDDKTLALSDSEKVDELVKKYLFHKGQMDENKQAMERYRDEILALVPEGYKKLVTDRFTVPVGTGHSTTVDWTLVSEEAKAEVDAAKSTKPTKRYLTKVKGHG